MSDSFTGQLWRGAAGIYAAILAHPFLAGLTDGSLEPDAFAFYVVQDALYLRGYAQALAEVATRAPDTAGLEMFARHAADVIAVERALHGSLLSELGVDPASAEAAEPAPTTLAYTSYLLAAARGGSYAEGVGAVLPCYWIYWEVGKELLRRGSPNPRYQQWIRAYGAEEYVSRRPSARWSTGTSAQPAATSGCSGTWATASRAGRCDTSADRSARTPAWAWFV